MPQIITQYVNSQWIQPPTGNAQGSTQGYYAASVTPAPEIQSFAGSNGEMYHINMKEVLDITIEFEEVK